ncbi:hypothetical protein ACFE04_031853 [Oxalis oulophora]
MQLKKDELQSSTNQNQTDQNQQSIANQATQFLQQTGESVKNIAVGAAGAVKNTLGYNSEGNNNNAPAGNTAAGNNNNNAAAENPHNTNPNATPGNTATSLPGHPSTKI